MHSLTRPYQNRYCTNIRMGKERVGTGGRTFSGISWSAKSGSFCLLYHTAHTGIVRHKLTLVGFRYLHSTAFYHSILKYNTIDHRTCFIKGDLLIQYYKIFDRQVTYSKSNFEHNCDIHYEIITHARKLTLTLFTNSQTSRVTPTFL